MTTHSQDPREFSNDELHAQYQASLEHTTTRAANFYLDEIRRREMAEQNCRIEDMTRTVRNLTWVIVVLTIVLVILAGATFLVALR